MALKYEDPRGGYVVELPTEGVISTAFDYDRDTIQDVFEKLIKRKNMGTSDTHYLKTVGGCILQNNSSTLISVNKGKPFDTLEEPIKMTFLHFEDRYGIPELYFELCPRYGPLAHACSRSELRSDRRSQELDDYPAYSSSADDGTKKSALHFFDDPEPF